MRCISLWEALRPCPTTASTTCLYSTPSEEEHLQLEEHPLLIPVGGHLSVLTPLIERSVEFLNVTQLLHFVDLRSCKWRKGSSLLFPHILFSWVFLKGLGPDHAGPLSVIAQSELKVLDLPLSHLTLQQSVTSYPDVSSVQDRQLLLCFLTLDCCHDFTSASLSERLVLREDKKYQETQEEATEILLSG